MSKRKSKTNSLARRLAAAAFVTSLLMAVADGFGFFEANEVVLLALFTQAVALLGLPTLRNMQEVRRGLHDDAEVG